MHLSAKQVARLLGPSRPLTKALYATIGARADDPAYALTQGDADAIAAHLDRQHGEHADAEFCAALGLDASHANRQHRLAVNDACSDAKQLFALAGLHTPTSWLD